MLIDQTLSWVCKCAVNRLNKKASSFAGKNSKESTTNHWEIHLPDLQGQREHATIKLIQDIPSMIFFHQPGFLGSKAIWYYPKQGQNLMQVWPFLLVKDGSMNVMLMLRLPICSCIWMFNTFYDPCAKCEWVNGCIFHISIIVFMSYFIYYICIIITVLSAIIQFC